MQWSICPAHLKCLPHEEATEDLIVDIPVLKHTRYANIKVFKRGWFETRSLHVQDKQNKWMFTTGYINVRVPGHMGAFTQYKVTAISCDKMGDVLIQQFQS